MKVEKATVPDAELRHDLTDAFVNPDEQTDLPRGNGVHL